MVEKEMGSVDCNANGVKFSDIPWSFEANWIITHGSLESSIAVESSDNPIAEPDHENMASNSPLILKPRRSDSGPCEIKICFKQKYEVGQIYVRSTARAYEIYYATSPHSINEYLSTVRCGVAVRDDIVLQTSSIEDVAEEYGECLSGYITAETSSNGGSTATSEDDWVKIKVSGDGSSPASDKTGTNGLNNLQDLYEATAQISDSDPCLSLTIRLLSLEDKGQVYVDEIYVFVDPVESTDSGNGAVLAGTSAQSSLLAMFVPTLLQLSKSGINQAQHKSDEVLKNRKMESESTTIDKIDSPQQSAKPDEPCKDTTETAEHQQHTSSNKCDEEKNTNGIQPSRLETAMEQLVSRLSRVEDICLRFEEKMLNPIERIEARLQQVENQLEKLAKNSHDFGLPRGTRISAPDFSYTESNSSSFYDDDLEKKDFACDNMPDLSLEANSNPGLIMSAPEFSYGEGDDDNDDLKPVKDSPHVKPKKTLPVADALAAALNGFMSTAVNSSEPIKIPTRLLGDVDEEIQGHANSCQIETRVFPAAVNDNTELSRYAQGLTVKAPDFTIEDTVSEEQLNSVQSSLDVASVTENKRKDEIVPPGIASADSCVNTESSAHARILTIKAPDFTTEETCGQEQLNFTQSSLDVASVMENERKDETVLPSIASADSYDNTETSSVHARNLTVKAPDFTVEDTVSEEQLSSVQSSLDLASVMENERKDEVVHPTIASVDLCDNTESSAHAQILTVKASDFTVEDTEEQLNSQSSLNVVSVTENERKDEILPSSTDSAVSCKFGRNEGTNEFGSASNGDSPAANGLLNGSSKVNMIEPYFQGGISGSPAEISKDSVPNSAKDLTVCIHQTFHETNQGKLHEAEIVAEFVKQNVAKESFEDDAGCVSEPSHVAFVDLEFPILEVKFRSDELMSTKSALEALLDYEAAKFTTEVSPIDPNGTNDVSLKEVEAVCSNGDEATDHPSPTNGLLLDLGISVADLEDAPKSLEGPPSIEEKMAASLI